MLLQDDFDYGDIVSPFGHEKSEEPRSDKNSEKFAYPEQNMGNLQDEVRPAEVTPVEEVGLSWSMFEKVKELGVGSFGVVHLVKCN